MTVADDCLRADYRRVQALANDRAQEVARLRHRCEVLKGELAEERAAHAHTIAERRRPARWWRR